MLRPFFQSENDDWAKNAAIDVGDPLKHKSNKGISVYTAR
jgi:hypothetical protein